MKGLFIPEITAEMFRNASVESVAELMADGKIYDIDYQGINDIDYQGIRIQQLKILPKWFEDVAAGKKKFEIRYNDRNFKVGDILFLEEYEKGKYTGRKLRRRVNYILYDNDAIGLAKGYCILGLESIIEEVEE